MADRFGISICQILLFNFKIEKKINDDMIYKENKSLLYKVPGNLQT